MAWAVKVPWCWRTGPRLQGGHDNAGRRHARPDTGDGRGLLEALQPRLGAARDKPRHGAIFAKVD